MRASIGDGERVGVAGGRAGGAVDANEDGAVVTDGRNRAVRGGAGAGPATGAAAAAGRPDSAAGIENFPVGPRDGVPPFGGASQRGAAAARQDVETNVLAGRRDLDVRVVGGT